MAFTKYKYYFKKPKSEIVKDILMGILLTGAICLAVSSPYFIRNVLNNKRWKKYPKQRVSDTFYKLRKQGLIEIEEINHQIYISLTEEGKKKAGMFQINSLEIKKPRKWDKKWRVIIFDVAELKKKYREAFRGKLKELGFIPLQKSVWIHPFDCEAEFELLKDFFGLSEKEIRLITTEKIGKDEELKKIFKL